MPFSGVIGREKERRSRAPGTTFVPQITLSVKPLNGLWDIKTRGVWDKASMAADGRRDKLCYKSDSANSCIEWSVRLFEVGDSGGGADLISFLMYRSCDAV